MGLVAADIIRTATREGILLLGLLIVVLSWSITVERLLAGHKKHDGLNLWMLGKELLKIFSRGWM